MKNTYYIIQLISYKNKNKKLARKGEEGSEVMVEREAGKRGRWWE
jgi:hypothetical protein